MRRSSGSVRWSSQSSSCRPIAPITGICGKCTWVSTKPGSAMQSPRSSTVAPGWSARTSANAPTASIVPVSS